jgi:hypothetical protein
MSTQSEFHRFIQEIKADDLDILADIAYHQEQAMREEMEPPSPPTKPGTSVVSERLTTSEIAQLRQQKRTISAYAQKVFSLRLRQRP